MRITAVVVTAIVVAACSESPTTDPTTASTPVSSASLARGGSGDDGAVFVRVDETGVDAPLPGGVCSFRPDGSGEFNNFLRTSTNGTRFLKIQDASGVITVVPLGQPAWTGTGRVSVNWPNYPGGDSFEMTMVGDRDAGGLAGSCKYKLANGVAVESFVRVR